MKPLLRSTFLFVLALGCASSSNTPAATTTPTTEPTPAPTPEPAVTTPVTPATEDAGAPVATPETTPAPAADASVATTPATPSTPTTTPSTPSRPSTPAAPSGGNVAAGHAAYNRACQRCHEDESEGPRPGLNWAEARMRTQIRSGSARMRAIPVSRLSDPDLDNVIAYLRSIHAVR